MTTTTTQTADTQPLKPVVVVPPAPAPIVITSKSLDAADRRRDWALFILAGGGFAMTAYAMSVLYIVKSDLHYAYYLGMMAMVAILVLFTGIAGLLVKRTVNVSRSGIVLEDHDNGGSDK